MEYGLFDLTLLAGILAFSLLVLLLPRPRKEEDPWQPLEDIDNKEYVSQPLASYTYKKNYPPVKNSQLKVS